MSNSHEIHSAGSFDKISRNPVFRVLSGVCILEHTPYPKNDSKTSLISFYGKLEEGDYRKNSKVSYDERRFALHREKGWVEVFNKAKMERFGASPGRKDWEPFSDEKTIQEDINNGNILEPEMDDIKKLVDALKERNIVKGYQPPLGIFDGQYTHLFPPIQKLKVEFNFLLEDVLGPKIIKSAKAVYDSRFAQEFKQRTGEDFKESKVDPDHVALLSKIKETVLNAMVTDILHKDKFDDNNKIKVSDAMKIWARSYQHANAVKTLLYGKGEDQEKIKSAAEYLVRDGHLSEIEANASVFAKVDKFFGGTKKSNAIDACVKIFKESGYDIRKPYDKGDFKSPEPS